MESSTEVMMPDLKNAREVVARLEATVGGVMRGQSETIRRVLATFAAGGHVLLEDYPGTGKTTLAKAISGSIEGAEFNRIQFTPDLLPSDILGVSILDPRDQSFQFQPGPVFSDILLADEINRASPRTQSALLEAMGEGQATIEGKQYRLDEDGLFFVIATQNPVEFRGTYPLPEAQMDRFAIQRALGYVSLEDEVSILESQNGGHPLDQLEPTVSLEEILNLRKSVQDIRLSPDLREYVVRLVSETRNHPEIKLPASPRASLNLMKISQSLALFEGHEFVTPQLIQSLAPDVIAHRLVVQPESVHSGRGARELVAEMLESVPVPV